MVELTVLFLLKGPNPSSLIAVLGHGMEYLLPKDKWVWAWILHEPLKILFPKFWYTFLVEGFFVAGT